MPEGLSNNVAPVGFSKLFFGALILIPSLVIIIFPDLLLLPSSSLQIQEPLFPGKDVSLVVARVVAAFIIFVWFKFVNWGEQSLKLMWIALLVLSVMVSVYIIYPFIVYTRVRTHFDILTFWFQMGFTAPFLALLFKATSLSVPRSATLFGRVVNLAAVLLLLLFVLFIAFLFYLLANLPIPFTYLRIF